MEAGSAVDKWICHMSVDVNALASESESTTPIKVVDYPRELTLMSAYMNDVQAKRFKQKQGFHAFVKSGLNLTVLKRDATAARSNIIDSGIRLSSVPKFQPEAA